MSYPPSRWEYIVEERIYDAKYDVDEQSLLKQKGLAGWELTSIVLDYGRKGPTTIIYYFKRPLPGPV